VHDTFHGGHPRTGVYTHRAHRSGSILRNRGEQALGDADVRGCQFQHRVQLYPWETFPPEIHGSHAYCLRSSQDAWPQGVITLKSDQRDALSCENATLTHAGRFGKEETQKLAVKVAKMHRGGTPAKTVTPGSSAGGTSKTHVAKQKQCMTVTPASTQRTTDQLVADEKKGVTDKEIQVDPTDADKKLRISMELEAI
jgi:hypothetical protein